MKIKKDENITKEVENNLKLIEEYTNHLKRLQADFENYIKRSEKEKKDLINHATYKLVLKLLNIVDDFEKALNVVRKSENKEVVDGVEIIFKNLYKILEEEGVKPINNEKKFDPYKHDAIDFAEGSEDGIILEELQRGYMLNDVIIRPAKVKISRGGKNE